MSYPGNASLAKDIQARILATFKQTLRLIESESLKEARLGCDFILRLDPMFEPARWLLDRIDSSGDNIAVDDLRQALADAEAAVGALPDADPKGTEDFPETLSVELEAIEPETPESDTIETGTSQAAAFGTAGDPVPATEEEVLDAPVAALDTESEQRVQDLLAEGQTAFERGEYQSSIDSWSRIFLIDIDHPEANERIEMARKLKSEAERTIEEAYHEALDQISSGQIDEARSGLEKVLEMQPDHLMALEQLEKINDPSHVPAVPAVPAAPAAPAVPAASVASAASVVAAAAPQAARAEPSGDSLLSDPDLDAGLDLGALETPLELDGPAGAIPIPKQRRPAKKDAGGSKKKLLLYAGGAVLVLVFFGGWLLTSNWNKVFPNSSEASDGEGQRADPIERAQELNAEGRTSTAISQLRRLPPTHERYAEAQSLIAQWQAAISAETQDEVVTEDQLAEFDALIAAANAAQGRREYLEVDDLLVRAAMIQPLTEAATNLKAVADAQLEPIRSLVAIHRQGEWEVVLRDLWLLLEDQPNNPDVKRLITDSYYNLGVRALQRGDTTEAALNFDEALEIAQTDDDLERATRFARAYQNRPEDLLYRIYVKYLPFR